MNRRRPWPRRVRSGGELALLAVLLLLVAGTAAVLLVRRGNTVPVDRDFVAIDEVPPRPPPPAPSAGASSGSFVSPCGRNENGHRNADNVIVSPGVRGGAHHVHEYIGNLSTDAFSTDRSLAAAATACRNGDLSTYYWPVLRPLGAHRSASHELSGNDEAHHHDAAPMTPASVLVEFRGNPAGEVVPMPRFLRLSVGNLRAATAPSAAPGTAQWTCSGTPERRTPLYPLCPPGQRVVRIYDFPGCWDGRRIDSPNHHEHVAFAAANGGCPPNTFPIPQLHLEVAYAVAPGRSFAIDAFPDQRRSPTTDHAQFINVMPDALMARAVRCLNSG